MDLDEVNFYDYERAQKDAFIKKLKVILASVGLILAAIAACSFLAWTMLQIHPPMLFETTRLEVHIGFPSRIEIFDNLWGKVLTGSVGKTVPPGSKHYECDYYDADICVHWHDQGKLHITHGADGEFDCYDVRWRAKGCGEKVLHDCFDLGDAHWFGGSNIYRMTWPVETWSYPLQPFVTGDVYLEKYGGVQERYWLASNGVGLFVKWDVPLFVGINETNDKQLCFMSKFVDSPYINPDVSPIYLNYTICRGPDMKKTHRYMSSRFCDKPKDIPNPDLFKRPIWSTWALHKSNITQDKITQFAKEIKAHDFPYCQLEIDDGWESVYGEMEFHKEKFPNVSKMVHDLESMGFKTTLWVHPFVDIGSSLVANHSNIYLWLKDTGGNMPAITEWWNGVALVLDLTNRSVLQYYESRLERLQKEYGISSFKFEAGEASYLPAGYKPHVPFYNPSNFTKLYAEIAYHMDRTGRRTQLRVGSRTQHLPVFVRMVDKDSNWDYDGGIKTVIPHVLNMGILGYPFLIPDMIGGNAYREDILSTQLPDKELYIRWMELNTLLPALQFSIPPWKYDTQTVEIVKNLLDLRERYIPTLLQLANESVSHGTPIIRPLWWVSPEDRTAQTIDSEFLVGNDILVAPILDKWSTSRDIYLPNGRWWDLKESIYLTGGRWHSNYQAALGELPIFHRES